MLNLRLYRAAFLPFVLALAVAAFSLGSRPAPLTSTLAPDAFDGARAFAELRSLAREFPHRRPGSPGDDALAARISHTLEGLGGAAGGGFTVHTRRFSAQTIDGGRTLTTVIAERPGSTNATPLLILAHRDAAGTRAQAELSGTVALLELARVFAARETGRTIVLVSTSGGSGGEGGAADFVAHAHGPFDAAVVLGDLAGGHDRTPYVVPYSDGFGSAPLQLQRTVSDALTQESGARPGAPSVLGQLAHLAFPFTVGEQGPLESGGLPAVLVQASGERGPTAGEGVSQERLEGFGRAVLSAVDALDTAPDVPAGMQTAVLVQRKVFPEWALALLVGTLLLPPLIVAVDGLARVRRRGGAPGRWTLWTLTCALPFLAAALFARAIGALGILGVAPADPVEPGAQPLDGTALAATAAVALVLALAWMLWPALVRRLRLRAWPSEEAAGLGMLLVLLVVSVLVWSLNPFAALLLLPAAHLWLLIVSPELRPRPAAALVIVAMGLLPLVLLVSFYADQLGLGPGEVAWTGVLLLAGGHIGIAGMVLWSAALGCAAAAGILALTAPAPAPGPAVEDHPEITIRGPGSYVGPGSLGGTESALRR
jgi:Peptidase family M28